ncbi:purine-nucleoside phosphorylase [Kibdelosporangium aridum]|uniref:Uridine phosphorylase n=1 Tax=Kibdelosporangium aridum TaxID=2030 RepID=A0A428Z3R8_KIBAR|nr:nucleoside phosphorylase [Kibdelosporangium aridum]RSM80725.1 purine-nucleoside phosphorylase [Kibdelosporangium aridum]
MDLPLLQFDATGDGMYSPSAPRLSEPWPERAVMCFFHEQIAALHEQGAARLAGRFSVEMGGHGIYITEDSAGESVAVFHPTVGAPSAVHHLERVVAAGVRSIVVCGGTGALVPLALGHVVVPTGSIRDEGTSFHYAPAGSSIEADPEVVAALTAFLEEQSVPHAAGLTWTTDAPFRETPSKVAMRRDQGCLVVEMEASALIAAARFRGVKLGLMVYAGDDLSGQTWDLRNWTASDARAKLLPLAIEASGRI